MGICLRLKKQPDYFETEPYLAAVFENSKLISAAVMTPPHKLVIHCIRNCKKAFELIALDLMDKKWKIPGILSLSEHSLQFSKTWKEISLIPFKAGMSERIYKLDKVTFPKNIKGKMRIAEQDDIELVSKWFEKFHKEAVPNDSAPVFKKFISTKIMNKEIFFWIDDKPVSMAAKARPTINGIIINLVFTPQELRRNGYATALVAHLSRHLLDSGWKFCALFTDLSNPTSNSIYQKVGYKPVCDFKEYYFEK